MRQKGKNLNEYLIGILIFGLVYGGIFPYQGLLLLVFCLLYGLIIIMAKEQAMVVSKIEFALLTLVSLTLLMKLTSIVGVEENIAFSFSLWVNTVLTASIGFLFAIILGREKKGLEDALITCAVVSCILALYYTYKYGIFLRSTGNENVNAHLNEIGVFVLIGYTISIVNITRSGKINNLLKHAALMVLFLSVLLLTYSRGALLGGFLITVYILLLRFALFNYRVLFSLMVVLVVAFFNIEQLKEWYEVIEMRVVSRVDQGEIRVNTNILALELFYENPIVGVGFGAFKEIYAQEYNLSEGMRAHSDYMEILSENGIIGFTLYIFTISLSMYLFIKNVNEIGYKLIFALVLLFSFIRPQQTFVLWYIIIFLPIFYRDEGRNKQKI